MCRMFPADKNYQIYAKVRQHLYGRKQKKAAKDGRNIFSNLKKTRKKSIRDAKK